MNEEVVPGENMEAAVPTEAIQQEAQLEQVEKEQMVPLSALQSERAQRQQKEQEAQFYRENLELFKANLGLQKPKEGIEALSDNDVLTVGEVKKLYSEANRQTQLSIEELRMTQKYPDYQDVITKHLPEVLKTNPRLQRTLENSYDFELAYHLAKNSDSYRAEIKKKNIHADAERIVQNSKQAGSLSSVGSTSPISTAKRYRDMSDDDFMSEVNKNLGYF